FALGIIAASVKRVSLTGFLLDQVAFFAQRTLHADKILLDVLAVGISAARSEFAVATVTDHQITSAFRARLIERNVRDLFALIEAPRGLAIRITGAGHELAETPTLQDHYAAAVLAIFFLSSFLDLGGIKVGQIDRILFGKSAAFGIFFVVRNAS